jgi:hypothetical protein
MAVADDELRAHLKRLTVWSVLCVAVGGVLLFVTAPNLRSFAWMTLGWAAVNLAIAFASRASRKPQDLRKLREFLMLNLGLNVGYVGVGATLALAAGDPAAKGSGWAVIVQGAGLFVLDLLLHRRLPESDDGPPVASV